MLDIIAKKRDKSELTKEEIDYFVEQYTIGNITDYQAAALIMAIYINGMTDEETQNFTISMANSGEIIDLSEINDIIIDKHSTGGVGDKVTLILMPIMAALGIPIVKMSGRGLGITGGTKDKLESIPGYNTELTNEEMINNVKKIGICLAGQSENLVPADKKIYALRDTISCTDSIPLISSSIMSKKMATGADKIILEVTFGSGAFMKNKEDAILLSKSMVRIGKLIKKETVCFLTNMDTPLGKNVGNSLEIMEVIESLKGNMEDDVKEAVEEIGAYMIKAAGKGNNIIENKQMINQAILNGKAFDKFCELVENQGGDSTYIKDVNKFEKAKYIIPVLAETSGYVEKINAGMIGNISLLLGAGRTRKEDKIDYSVGIVLNKKIGDRVEKNDILCYIHSNNENIINDAVQNAKEAFCISSNNVVIPKTILGIVE